MPQRIPYHRAIGQADAATNRRNYERQSSRRDDIAFYQSSPWRKLRAAYLASRPLCERCEAIDLVVIATHVHHKIERKTRPDLALEWSNLEALCSPCHTSHHKSKGKR
jgi:5-methylcytosine-specific restriction protein A